MKITGNTNLRVNPIARIFGVGDKPPKSTEERVIEAQELKRKREEEARKNGRIDFEC